MFGFFAFILGTNVLMVGQVEQAGINWELADPRFKECSTNITHVDPGSIGLASVSCLWPSPRGMGSLKGKRFDYVIFTSGVFNEMVAEASGQSAFSPEENASFERRKRDAETSHSKESRALLDALVRKGELQFALDGVGKKGWFLTNEKPNYGTSHVSLAFGRILDGQRGELKYSDEAQAKAKEIQRRYDQEIGSEIQAREARQTAFAQEELAKLVSTNLKATLPFLQRDGKVIVCSNGNEELDAAIFEGVQKIFGPQNVQKKERIYDPSVEIYGNLILPSSTAGRSWRLPTTYMPYVEAILTVDQSGSVPAAAVIAQFE